MARSGIAPAVVSVGRRALFAQSSHHSPAVATMEILGPLPDVLAHEPSLTQVVSNLLSNAVKFTPDGGTITVDLRADEAMHDRPAGMSKAEASMAVEQVLYTVQGAHSLHRRLTGPS